MSKNKSNFIKLLAFILMLIDHVGAIFYPNITFLRIIGRLSFPIFAYQMAVSLILTSNQKRLLKKLFIFALISQIPYSLAFNTIRLNVLFTFLFSAIGVIYNPIYGLLAYFSDYGLYGVLIVYLFYYITDLQLRLILFTVLTFIYSALVGWYIQLFSILAFLVVFINYEKKITLHRYFFYLGYPVHLMIFILVRRLL